MTTKEEIKAIVSKIRIACATNPFKTDIEETIKRAESEFNCKIEVEKIPSSFSEGDFQTLIQFYKLSGSVQEIGSRQFRIRVNPGDYPLRQTFTLAHELGHILLNHTFSNGDILEDSTENIIGRPSHGFDKNDQKEIEANHFAGELLMPEDLVQSHFSAYLDKRIPDQQLIIDASEKFGVSKAAMFVRLSFLGYRF